MSRRTGRTFSSDEDGDEVLANTFEIVHEDGVVQLALGALDGSRGGRKPLVSESKDVSRWHNAVERETRWHAGRYRKANPVPKPVTSGRKRPTSSVTEGACLRCGGAGEYEWGDGFWKKCPVCHPDQGEG